MADKNNDHQGVLPTRSRIILIAPTGADASSQVEQALQGGDIASVILPVGEMNEAEYATHAELLIPLIQATGAAALIMKDTQVLGRADADGIFIPSDAELLLETMERFSPKKIVGFGGAKNKHNSMVAGDIGPDFIFFGKVDGDIKPEVHPKNVKLAQWWSEMVEIPCVVMAGSELESVTEACQSGAEFVALGKAAFEGNPMKNVKAANLILDEHAPSFALDA